MCAHFVVEFWFIVNLSTYDIRDNYYLYQYYIFIIWVVHSNNFMHYISSIIFYYSYIDFLFSEKNGYKVWSRFPNPDIIKYIPLAFENILIRSKRVRIIVKTHFSRIVHWNVDALYSSFTTKSWMHCICIFGSNLAKTIPCFKTKKILTCCYLNIFTFTIYLCLQR